MDERCEPMPSAPTRVVIRAKLRTPDGAYLRERLKRRVRRRRRPVHDDTCDVLAGKVLSPIGPCGEVVTGVAFGADAARAEVISMARRQRSATASARLRRTAGLPGAAVGDRSTSSQRDRDRSRCRSDSRFPTSPVPRAPRRSAPRSPTSPGLADDAGFDTSRSWTTSSRSAGRPSRERHARGLHDARLPGRRTPPGPSSHPRHRRALPAPGPAGEDHHHARRAVRRPGLARHRRRLERGGVASASASAFPPVATRFERLEETLQICLQMWRGDDVPVRGQALPAAPAAECAAVAAAGRIRRS